MSLIPTRRLSMSLLVGCAVAVMLVSAAAPSAMAVVWVPETFYEYVNIGGYTAEGQNPAAPERVDFSVTLDNGQEGTGWASSSGVLPLPTELDLSIAGADNSAGFGGIGGTAYVETRYQFSVPHDFGNGPGSVPIQLITSGWVEVHSGGLADGAIGTTFARLTYPNGQIEATNEDARGGHDGRFEFDQTIDLTVAADTAYNMIIYLHSHGQGAGENFFYNAHAFLDPIIQIDPGFEYRDQFHIEYSPGISAPAPIPEPAALGLMLTGLLGLGATAWRRKRGSTC